MKPEIAEYIKDQFSALNEVHPKNYLASFHRLEGAVYALAAIGEISDIELVGYVRKLESELIED